MGHPSTSDQLLDLAFEQIHDRLVADVRHRWSEISKVCALLLRIVQRYLKDSQNCICQLKKD